VYRQTANRFILTLVPAPAAVAGGFNRRGFLMMAAVFATMLLALLTARYGPVWLAALSLLACLGLSVGLFLFEIYSPDYGFRMPWIQT
jgi:hypothetical protein